MKGFRLNIFPILHLLYLIIHLQVEQEYCAAFTLEHFLGFHNYIGDQTIKRGLLLKQRLGKVEKKLVLAIFSHSGLVQLGRLDSDSTEGEVTLTKLKI